jgi:hypothetical protein
MSQTLATARDIDSLSREEAELVAARALQAVAAGKRISFADQMHLVHLAVRLERFAKEAGPAA